MSIALAAVTVVAALLGLVLSATEWGEQHLVLAGDVRMLVVVAAGLLLAGAGLMELASWQVDRRPQHRRRGTALVVFGLATAASVGMADLVHDVPLEAVLNPFTTSVAGGATLVLLALTAGNPGVAPWVHVPRILLGCVVLVGGLVALRAITGVTIDQAPAVRMTVELALTLGWLATAFSAHRSGFGSAETALWVWFAIFSGMRAAAVQEPEWGLASALLLVAIALVVIAAASWELVAATDAEHRRVQRAEEALAAARGVIVHHEEQRRDIRHDARNAMLALRMSTYTLARHGELLDPEMRRRLNATVVEQVEQLEELLGGRAGSLARRRTTR